MSDTGKLEAPVDRSNRAGPREKGRSFSTEHRHHCLREARGGIEVVRNLEGLDDLSSDWRKLARDSPAPFLAYSWNRSWFQCYGKDYDEILIFVHRVDGKVTAILPCYRRGSEIRLAGDSTCDFQDIIARTITDAAKVLAGAAEWLRDRRAGFRFCFPKSSSLGWISRIASRPDLLPPRFLTFSKCFAPCPYVSIEKGFESYLSVLPGKIRQEFRRSLRKLNTALPGVHHHIHRGKEITADLVDEVAAFHERHFRMKGEDPLASDRLRRHLAMIAASEDVGLQVATLRNGADLLAVDIGFAVGGRYSGFLCGFDPAYSALAPGKCLLLSRIDEWVERDGIRVLDFLSGDESYKRRFTEGEAYEVSSIWMFPDRPANRLRRLTLEGMARAKKRVKRLVWRSRVAALLRK